MLQYTSTHIVNDANSFEVVTEPDGRKKFRLKFGPELDEDGITKVYVNKARAAQLATATIDLAKVYAAATTEKKFRITVYIRVHNSNASTYANDWVFKGKPLNLGEFDANSYADDIVATIRTHMLNIYGAALVNVTDSGAVHPDPDDPSVIPAFGTITITAKTQFQQFLNQDNKPGVVVEKSVAAAQTGALSAYGDVMWVPVTATGSQAPVTVTQGVEAAGDFVHLTKDLRLPTLENLRWYGIAEGDVMNGEANDDRPNPQNHYTQFTIVYEKDRGLGNATVLGGLGRSRTTHVFYVADSTPATAPSATPTLAGVAAQFEADLQSLTLPTGASIDILPVKY